MLKAILPLSFFILCFSLPSIAQERFITIDQREIWIKTIGLDDRQPGQPIIILESGLGTPMDHWDRILDGISQLAPVLAYDRPGIGKSEPDEEMPTIQNVANTLLKILDQLQLEPPYVLVGHSLGGVYVRGFAVYHPEKLAGLVIIDPADFTETQENQKVYYAVLGWEEVKVDSLMESFVQNRIKRYEGAPISIKEEIRVLEDMRKRDFKEIRENPLPNIPVHMIIGGLFDTPEQLRPKTYDSEALFRSKMKHRMARWLEVVQSVDKGMLLYSGDAGHFVHYYDPELVISSIKMVLLDYELMQKKE